MTALTSATSTSRAISLHEPVRRPACAEEPPRPFEEALREARRDDAGTDATAGSSPAPASESENAGEKEAAVAADVAPGEAPEGEHHPATEKQVSRDESAEVAPQAQDPSAGGGTPENSVNEPADEVESGIAEPVEPRTGHAASSPDQTTTAGTPAHEADSATADPHSVQVAGAPKGLEQGETGAPQPVTAPTSVIEAPPTVHRLNELLLTMDRRALQLAGVLRHQPLADSSGPPEAIAAGVQESESGRGRHAVFLSNGHGPASRDDAASPAPDQDFQFEGAPRITSADSGRESQAARLQARHPEEQSRPAPTDNAATTPTHAANAAKSHNADPLARLDASFRGVARLAATPASAENTGTGASAGPAGGIQVRDVAPADPRASAAPPAREPATRTEQAFQAQLSRGMTAAVAQRGGRITLRLTPETLGSLKIDMTVKEGAVSARFEAATSEARELLGRSMEHLREVLHAKGLHVERLEVREHAAEPPRTERDGQHQPDADAGARPHDQSGQEPESGGGDRQRGTPEHSPGLRRGWDAAEPASESNSGAPPEDGAAAWSIGIDAVA